MAHHRASTKKMMQQGLVRCFRLRTLHAAAAAAGHCRFFFTNTDQVKRDDPYQQLGLQWGDGATSAEIRQAYRQRAAVLHPDVNQTDSPQVALRKFQELKRAYETLIKVHSSVDGSNPEQEDAWRFSVWRNGDRLALDRTDVAGVARKRPVPPAETERRRAAAGALLGHPSGRGTTTRNEYLEDGSTAKNNNKRSSSVGRGWNKWVTPKEFVPWNRQVNVASAAANSNKSAATTRTPSNSHDTSTSSDCTK